MLTDLGSEHRELYRWQLDALISWLRCGRRGVIEAVTGSGKTDVAIAAASDALRRGRFVLVVVPSRVLMEQWHGRLTAALPEARIGRLGDSGKDRPASCDVLIATRHSAAAYKPVPPGGVGGLLIADECHGLGGGTLRRAMLPQYDERLGLTATLERSDDAVAELLLPYFGGHLPPLRLRAGHRRRRVRAASGGVRRGRAVRRRAGRVHRHGAAARERSSSPPAGERHATRAVRRLPRRGRASRRTRCRCRRPRGPRVSRRVLQAARDRGADQRQVRAARRSRAGHPGS